MRQARQLIAQNLRHDHDLLKRFYDKKHRQNRYETGQKVLVFNPSFKLGDTKPFTTHFHGPAIITKKLRNNAYEVNIRDKKWRWAMKEIAIQRLRPYYDS